MQGVVPEHDHDLYLGAEYDSIYNSPFWYELIKQIEKRCLFLGIRSRGVADGDLALPGCHYVSLRNEAYISVPILTPILSINTNSKYDLESKSETNSESNLILENNNNDQDNNNNEIKDDLISPNTQHYKLAYPPNSYGWNAANHPNPMLDVIFFLRENQKSFEEGKNFKEKQINEYI